MKWRSVTLESVCESISDGDHLAPPKSDAGVPFITISNIDGNNNIDFSRCMYVPRSYYEKVDQKRKPQKGDVLYSVVGSFGKPVLVREDAEFVFQRHIAILRPKADVLSSRFLYATMLSPAFYALADAAAVGTAQRTISLSSLRGMEISLPPLAVQRKIASVLGEYDDLIENNRRRIALLEKMVRELYRERFVRRLVKTDKAVRIGDVCTCYLGGTPSRSKAEYWNGDIPWINSGKVNDLRIVEPSEYITNEGLKHSATKLLPRKTTVLAITGATLGQVSLLEIESAANQSVIGIVQNERMPYTFIYPLICERIADLVALQTGGAQQHINKDNVESMEFDLPSESDVGNYHRVAEPMYDEMAALLFSNIQLSQQRDLLLPRLMSGKINLGKLV